MHSDCYFTTGSSHSICQDYALTRDEYVIISDGCSSSPNTDFGSRLLVHSLDQVFRYHDDIDNATDRAIAMADAYARGIGLPANCLDATLFYIKHEDDFLYVGFYGDGAIVTKENNGLIKITTIEYESGAPFYLSYQLDRHRKNGYLAEFGNTRKVKNYTITKKGELLGPHELFRDGNSWAWPTRDVDVMAVMSDGIYSFIRTSTQEKIPFTDVIKSLMSFKLMKGLFVERRTRRFLKNCRKNGINHYDDISVAAIHMDKS